PRRSTLFPYTTLFRSMSRNSAICSTSWKPPCPMVLFAACGVISSIGVIPVGGLDGGHEVRDARAVLRDAHRDLSGRTRIAVAYVAAVALVRDVPKGNPGFWEKIGDRHECRADNAKGMLDAVHLQDLHESFFGRHLHRYNPSSAVPYINSRPVLKNSGELFGGLPERRQMPPRR